jgi:hypothetical protein
VLASLADGGRLAERAPQPGAGFVTRHGSVVPVGADARARSAGRAAGNKARVLTGRLAERGAEMSRVGAARASFPSRAPGSRQRPAVVQPTVKRYVVDWPARYRREHRTSTRLGRRVRTLQRRLRQLELARHLQAHHETAQDVIRRVFGPWGDQAVRVAYCETGGTYNPAATNGQYRGVLQMGAWERATYGDSPTVEGQAQAAYRYFAATGHDWSPWECKP